jgi:predicted dehydrogenase
MDTTKPFKIGILGASRACCAALIAEATSLREHIVIDAIASRDPSKATNFATLHGIPRVLTTYAELVADPEIDAVYNGLPNSMHYEWSMRALGAGKHVLCEKPLACNAEEAQHLVSTAERNELVLAEGMHYRFIPVTGKMKEYVVSGALGAVQHISANLCVPAAVPKDDIRFQYDLGGGATLDCGCYPINLIRYIIDAEPTVVAARAKTIVPRVDRWMRADLMLPSGVTARMTCCLRGFVRANFEVCVSGTLGEMKVWAPYFSSDKLHRIRIATKTRNWIEEVRADHTSYWYQLRSFSGAMRQEQPFPLDPRDAVANMKIIDSIYEKAGLGKRGRSIEPEG